MARWKITIDTPSLGGYPPNYINETYPSFGNKNQAGAMQNMDLTNPGFITQGPGLADYSTSGPTISSLVRSVLEIPVAATESVAIGGSYIYHFSTSSILGSHLIDKAAVTGEDGEDVVQYGSNVYYTYNHSGSAGDIGKADTGFAGYDDDWGSTVPSGAATLDGSTGVGHQLKVGGNDVMYFANGRYIGSYDGTTLQTQALDLSTGSVVASIAWLNDRLWIAANKPSTTQSNVKTEASIYVWNGTTDSWDSSITFPGLIGALFVRRGIMYVWYAEISTTGLYKLGYISGNAIVDLCQFSGSLPMYYQVTEYKDFLMWVSSGVIYAWGSGEASLPARLFQYCDGGYTNVGGVGTPFGKLLIGSYDGVSTYRFAQVFNYDTACNWKSLLFDITGENEHESGAVEKIRINFEKLTSGAAVALALVDNQGRTIYSDAISYAKATATTPKHTLTSVLIPLNGKITENFRIEFDYTSGSTTAPVKIKNIKIWGRN